MCTLLEVICLNCIHAEGFNTVVLKWNNNVGKWGGISIVIFIKYIIKEYVGLL